MTNSRARTMVTNSVVGLTRYLVRQGHISKDRAYMKLYQTELFGLLSNVKTGLFLEPNERLIDLLKTELKDGVPGLYAKLSVI